jgi:plasmid stabilization system protein ParE
MQDRSENQIATRLLQLENEEQAERRVRLSGERYLSLLQDPDSGRSYVFRHGVDDTEGAEVPDGTEFYEYDTIDVARRAFNQILGEARRAGTVVEDDSTDDLGDFETDGAEIRDLYADEDEDPLTQDDVISEEDS